LTPPGTKALRIGEWAARKAREKNRKRNEAEKEEKRVTFTYGKNANVL